MANKSSLEKKLSRELFSRADDRDFKQDEANQYTSLDRHVNYLADFSEPARGSNSKIEDSLKLRLACPQHYIF